MTVAGIVDLIIQSFDRWSFDSAFSGTHLSLSSELVFTARRVFLSCRYTLLVFPGNSHDLQQAADYTRCGYLCKIHKDGLFEFLLIPIIVCHGLN